MGLLSRFLRAGSPEIRRLRRRYPDWWNQGERLGAERFGDLEPAELVAIRGMVSRERLEWAAAEADGLIPVAVVKLLELGADPESADGRGACQAVCMGFQMQLTELILRS